MQSSANKRTAVSNGLATSTDSDLESTDSSKGSTASQPQSPTKKAKKQKKSGGDSSSSDIPPTTVNTESIILSNPFEDDPNAATTLRSLNSFSRQLNQRMMNCHYNPYQNSFHNNMPPSTYPNYNNHSGPTSNGPGQQVIMNSQGGTYFPCGLCHKETSDSEAINCKSSCFFWFHRTCVGLTETAYKLLTSEPCAEWVCDKCIREKKIPLVRLRNPSVAY